MGREIRRVPPDWQHPKDASGRFEPMLDRSFEAAMAEWTEGKRKWDAGEDPARDEYEKKHRETIRYEEWNGPPPTSDYYRPAWPEESRTAFQVYENVSEGTPCSPVFATRDEMIHWLVNHGDGMGIGGRQQKMSREGAESFADSGYAPSMIATPGRGIESGLAIHEPHHAKAAKP